LQGDPRQIEDNLKLEGIFPSKNKGPASASGKKNGIKKIHQATDLAASRREAVAGRLQAD
jgi:hypothetical protein